MTDLIDFDKKGWNGRSEAVYGTPLQRRIQDLVTNGLGYESLRDPHVEEDVQHRLMRLDGMLGKISNAEYQHMEYLRSEGFDVPLEDLRRHQETEPYSRCALRASPVVDLRARRGRLH